MTAISDDNLMQQPRDLDGCLDCVKALQPLRVFNLRTGRESIALSAQSSQSIVPELISAAGDGSLQLDYALLTVRLIGAVKVLADKVDALESAAGGS